LYRHPRRAHGATSQPLGLKPRWVGAYILGCSAGRRRSGGALHVGPSARRLAVAFGPPGFGDFGVESVLSAWVRVSAGAESEKGGRHGGRPRSGNAQVGPRSSVEVVRTGAWEQGLHGHSRYQTRNPKSSCAQRPHSDCSSSHLRRPALPSIELRDAITHHKHTSSHMR
jgi:hypothetical protein